MAETQATEDAPLSEEEIKEVEKYMRIVAGAFSSMNAEAIESLSHPGGDPRGKKNTVEYNQMLMDGGDRVKSWTAKRYARPDWEYLETSDFYPVPTVWIDVTLSDGKRDYPIFFALAPDSGGQLLQCYYVDKK